MTTPEDYSVIADEVYGADPMWKNPPYVEGDRFPLERESFQVVSPPVSDPVTGLQAMTVVPVVNGQPDYSHVYISYAGTNPAHHADISADAQVVMGGSTASAAQAAQALEYAKKTMADLREKHPGAAFETVGHSLGGFLAMYVAGEVHLSSTSFNGPDAWEALSPQARKWLLAQIATGKHPFHNYVNEWDFIGNSGGNRSGAADYVVGKWGQEFFDNHNIGPGFDFDDKDGSVIGAGAGGRNLLEISNNALSGMPDQFRPVAAGIMAAITKALQDPATGAVAGMVVSGLVVTMDTFAAGALATSFLQLEAPLLSIKGANSTLVPQLERSLIEAKNAVGMIPFLKEADIENCVAIHRLQVHENIDEVAVAAVDKRVDAHIAVVHQLIAGVSSAAQNAVAQDAQWANVYAGL